MKINSDELEENSEGNEEFILISVLEFFCRNFIRGFNKLIYDLGFESIINNESEEYIFKLLQNLYYYYYYI